MIQFTPVNQLALIAVLFLGFGSLQAQEFHVSSGPKDEQVLQRNFEGLAEVIFQGNVTGKKLNGKRIEARLSGATGVAANFDWIPAGQIQKQAWTPAPSLTTEQH